MQHMQQMQQYTFTQRYRSSYGEGDTGDEVTLTDDQAADINRDSPGTLVAVTRAVEHAPNNRQVTAAKNRNDRGAESPIDKTTFKAVKG